jgi:hypothetical protein
MRVNLCSESSDLLLLVFARIAPPKACMRKQRTSPPIEYFGETREANFAEGNTTGCSDDAAKGHIDGCSKEDRSEQYGRGLHDCRLMIVGEDIPNIRAPDPENSTAKGNVSTDGPIRRPVCLRRIQDWIIISYTFIRRRSQKEYRIVCGS